MPDSTCDLPSIRDAFEKSTRHIAFWMGYQQGLIIQALEAGLSETEVAWLVKRDVAYIREIGGMNIGDHAAGTVD